MKKTTPPKEVFPERKFVEIPNRVVMDQLLELLKPELREVYNVSHTVNTNDDTTILILYRIKK